MNEHERMLAEGPRVAPEPTTAEAGPTVEPPTAEAGFAFEQPTAEAGPTVEQPKRPVAPARRGRAPYLRLMPLAAFALVVLASAAGYARYAWFVFVALVIVSMILRTRRRTL